MPHVTNFDKSNECALGPEVFLIVASHDPGPWLAKHIESATRELYSATLFEAWSA